MLPHRVNYIHLTMSCDSTNVPTVSLSLPVYRMPVCFLLFSLRNAKHLLAVISRETQRYTRRKLCSPIYGSLLSLCRRPRFASFCFSFFVSIPCSTSLLPSTPSSSSSSTSFFSCSCFAASSWMLLLLLLLLLRPLLLLFFYPLSITVTSTSRYASSLNRPSERTKEGTSE